MDEWMRFESGKLSDGTQTIMLKKTDRLFKEYYESTEINKSLPLEKIHNTGPMIVFRP